MKVTLEVAPLVTPAKEAIVTLLDPIPLPTVNLTPSSIVVAPSVIAPLPEANVALLPIVVVPSVNAVFVVDTFPKMVLELVVLVRPPVNVCPPPNVTPPVFIKDVGVLIVPAPRSVKEYGRA